MPGGYRDPRDDAKHNIILTKQVYSKIPAIRTQSCENHKICKDFAKPMDNDLAEEVQPMPLPVDRLKYQQDYIQTNFNERHGALKKKLLINGDVKILSAAERSHGVPIMVPSQDGIDDWLKQSMQLG